MVHLTLFIMWVTESRQFAFKGNWLLYFQSHLLFFKASDLWVQAGSWTGRHVSLTSFIHLCYVMLLKLSFLLFPQCRIFAYLFALITSFWDKFLPINPYLCPAIGDPWGRQWISQYSGVGLVVSFPSSNCFPGL